MKIPTYPEEFFSFKNGAYITDEKINQWIKECIDYLEENKTSSFRGKSSGDTRVSVHRWKEIEGSDYYEYEITVSRGYSQGYVRS